MWMPPAPLQSTPPVGYKSWDEYWTFLRGLLTPQLSVKPPTPTPAPDAAKRPTTVDPFLPDFGGGGGAGLPGTTYASAGQPQAYNSERLLGRLEDMRMGNIAQTQYMPYLRRF